MMPRLRYALRMLLKQPAFTAIAVFTLALGIGANTAIFSVVNAVLLRPLPFKNADELVSLGSYDTRTTPGNFLDTVSFPDFADWRAQNQVFAGLAVYKGSPFTLTNGQEAVHLQGLSASSDIFSILGVQPQLGRAFLPKEDEPGNHVVILSHELWQSRFGGDRRVINQTITLNGIPYQIIGVMPPRFAFPIETVPAELWTTMADLRQSVDGNPPVTEIRGSAFLRCVGRLKPGVSLMQAQSNITQITAALARQYPASNQHTGIEVISFLSSVVGHVRPALIMLLATAGCVLLVACVNVANLLLARSVARQKEISIRAALGAGRGEIVMQLLTESALLGVAGGLIGLLLAVWGVDSLARQLPANLPRATEISPDARVVAFTAAVSVLVGCLAGLMPAWRASQPNLVGSLNESSRGSSASGHGIRLRGVLVVVEIVLALVLLSSAGLLGRSFLRLRDVSPGFNPRGVMTVRFSLPDTPYGKAKESAEFVRQLMERIKIVPGVNSAAMAWWIPLSGSEISFDMDVEERPRPEAEREISQANSVTPDYFKTLHIPLLRGRTFTDRDTIDSPKVAVVNESFARQFFPGEDPIGKRITPGGTVDAGKPPVREIVGIVADAKLINLTNSAKSQVYCPHQQFAVQAGTLLVRTDASPAAIMPVLRNAVAQLDKDVPLYRPRLLEEYVASTVAQPRFNALLVGLFSALALLLAAAGIFGVMSYSVTQRTQEIGIRLALGAQRIHVLRLIVGQGMRLVAFGVSIGLLITLGLNRLLSGLLYGISATDISTLLFVSIVLALVAFLACWLPARRASGIDPIVALREG
jgi:putative ABC transport system permease protein